MGRAPCCDKANVKKGPWSPEEDTKLKEYVEKYGTGGNWITLPHKAGLRRCGKSCRLRWLNYLRPNIKHGDFTDEEDRIICSLFANIGSRWSVIATQLPGRTDNDIKNYWNTKLKKKLMATPSQRKPPLPQSPNLSFHPHLSIYRDLDVSDISYSKSCIGIDPAVQPTSHFGAGINNADSSSAFLQNQEVFYGAMQYHNPIQPDNHIVVFGSEASCSSNSDGSYSQMCYGRRDLKLEDMQIQWCAANGYNNSQQKLFVSYGGSNIYGGDRGNLHERVDQTGSCIGGSPMDCYQQDANCHHFLVEDKLQDRSMYCDFSLVDDKGYWMRS